MNKRRRFKAKRQRRIRGLLAQRAYYMRQMDQLLQLTPRAPWTIEWPWTVS